MALHILHAIDLLSLSLSLSLSQFNLIDSCRCLGKKDLVKDRDACRLVDARLFSVSFFLVSTLELGNVWCACMLLLGWGVCVFLLTLFWRVDTNHWFYFRCDRSSICLINFNHLIKLKPIIRVHKLIKVTKVSNQRFLDSEV